MKVPLPALLLIALTLSSCGKGEFSKRGGNASGTYREALQALPPTLDPGRVQDVEMIGLLGDVFEGLVSYDENNRVVPQLAESWDVSPSGTLYTFHLRKGAKFHNGREVTAEDFVWSFTRNLNPKFDSPTAPNYLQDIVGVDEFVSGKARNIRGLEAPDAHTLKITIDKPRAYFLGKLTYPCAFVLAKEAAGTDQIGSAQQAVGTGPFKLAEVKPGLELVLAANKDYYQGAPLLEKISRPIIQDAATRLSKYRSDELDALALQRQDLDSAQKDPALKPQLQMLARPAVFYVGLNQGTYAPFQDPRVRKAVAMAIDRIHLAHDLLGGLPPATGLLPPGVLGFREGYQGLRFDPEGAKKLLAEAGYPDGKGLPPLSLTYRDQTPDAQIVGIAVEHDLSHNLGIKLSLQAKNWGTLLALRNQGKLQMYFGSWFADYLDPQNFLSMLLTSDSPQNRDSIRDPEFDRLCAEADTASDEKKRASLYQTAEDRIVLSGARIPLYFGQDILLVKPRVKGLQNNLMGTLPLRKTSLSGG